MPQLTELVRLLEERGHTFPADPLVVTEKLRGSTEAPVQRLHRRAEQIDADHALAERLHRHQRHYRLLLSAAVCAWFAAGLFGTYGLMRHSQLNFMLVLAGVLGTNTVMLLWWAVSLTLRRPTHGLHAAELLLRGRDPITQALASLYAQAAARPRFVWQHGAAVHRLALAALCGMFTAALLLLTFRQYSFNWESTLLGSHRFGQLLGALAWLPEKVGFAVPSAEAVAAVRNRADAAHAAHWGSLLLGSLLCYGILPRLAAWLLCRLQLRRRHERLNLNLPYYRAILDKWQQRITDSSADFTADPTPAAPTSPVPPAEFHGSRWAVRLDMPDAPPLWTARLEAEKWHDCGILSERADTAALLERIQAHGSPIRLLAGVRAAAAPDRGSLRRLASLAQQAHGGLVLMLLDAAAHPETAAQWQTACKEYGWTTE